MVINTSTQSENADGSILPFKINCQASSFKSGFTSFFKLQQHIAYYDSNCSLISPYLMHISLSTCINSWQIYQFINFVKMFSTL